MRNIEVLDVASDHWILDLEDTRGKSYTFKFDYLPNEWLKKTHKNITRECFIKKKPKFETLHRYNYSLEVFYDFLKIYGITINTYKDLDRRTIDLFIFHLQQSKYANSTVNVIMSALKWVIYHGQTFDYEGFPINELFDGEEYQAFGVDDIAKTKVIPDDVIKQIETALTRTNDSMMRSLLEIGIDTGIRLSEALDLEVGCLIETYNDDDLLHVISRKNYSERFIPVSKRVRRAVETLISDSEDARKESGKSFLTMYRRKRSKTGNSEPYIRLNQNTFRYNLKQWVSYHNITNSDGQLYDLTFHSFRHTLGTHMLNRGMTIFEIAKYLGHESLHSTAHYAKIMNPTIIAEYRKIGFVGMIVEKVNQESFGANANLDAKTIRSAALPDGVCRKPIDNEGKVCKQLNLCLICPKFITTPAHLQIHKDHLNRLRKDREQYIAENYIGTADHLLTIETSLEEVIRQLEAMKNGQR